MKDDVKRNFVKKNCNLPSIRFTEKKVAYLKIVRSNFTLKLDEDQN